MQKIEALVNNKPERRELDYTSTRWQTVNGKHQKVEVSYPKVYSDEYIYEDARGPRVFTIGWVG